MIVLVIGQSASGKTTYVKRSYVKDCQEPRVDEKTGLPFVVSGGTAVIGKYNVGKRCEGTDTLSFTCQDAILDLIKRLALSGVDVVAEGDRITNDKVIGGLVRWSKTPIRLILFRCPIDVSCKRRASTGSNPNEKFVKATATKAYKMFQKYKSLVAESFERTHKPM